MSEIERTKSVADQPWTWDETRWRSSVERVRAGRRLEPPAWPEGAEVAVALSFDSDHETIPLRNNETHPGKLSMGSTARVSGFPGSSGCSTTTGFR